MTSLAVSVVVCTHNPRPHFLSRVLGALAEQTLDSAKWELLLIDNASAEPLAGRFDLSWHPNGRHILETELGLTPARLRGIAEARGEAIIFVDDDNVVAPDYCEMAMRLGERYPYLGAWGGCIDVEYEVPPAEWVKGHRAEHAYRHFDAPRWSNIAADLESQPYGAGMCLRKSVCERYAEDIASDSFRRSLDRKGTNLLAGGDIDLVLCSAKLGLGWGNFPDLKVLHLIPEQRLSEEFLLRLREEVCVSNQIVAVVNAYAAPPPSRAKFAVRNLWTRLRHGARTARFQAAEYRGMVRGAVAARQYLDRSQTEHDGPN